MQNELSNRKLARMWEYARQYGARWMNPILAEDFAQEFIMQRLQGNISCAKFIMVDFLRRENKKRWQRKTGELYKIISIDANPYPVADPKDYMELIINRIDARNYEERINAILRKCNFGDSVKRIMQLSLIDGLHYKKIAKLIGLTENSVMTYLANGRAKMWKVLNGEA